MRKPVFISMRMTVVITCLFVSGCTSGEPKPVPVTGVVQFNGNPLNQGDVVFVPVDPQSSPSARGKIGEGGIFNLTTIEEGDGAIPGDYKVAVFCTDGLREIPGMAAPAVGPSLIPIRYNNAETSNLTQTVGENGGEVTVNLTD